MTETPKHSTFQQAVIEFARSVEITRDVRFQANLRLTGRSRSSAYIVSFLSTYVIALSLLPNIIALQSSQSQILLACSIVLSVFVIFTSLIDGSQNFFYHGELLHSCARKIATIHHDLKMVDGTNDDEKSRAELKELQRRYHAALEECPVNHDNVDFYKEIASKPHLFPQQYGNWPTFIVWILYRIRIFWLTYLWVAPHVVVTVVISAVVFFSVLHGAHFKQ